MTGGFPAIGGCAVTAAAMRAAAAVIGESALPGPPVTGTGTQITIQVSRSAGDLAGRAAQAGRLARIAGTVACRDGSQHTACTQIRAYGQVRGIPVGIFTQLGARAPPGRGGPVPLAAGPGGQVTAVPAGKLPHGRVAFATAAEWVTRLAAAHTAGRLHDELRRLGRYPVLVIDEVSYIPFEPEAANLFFQLVSARYERASLIVTSNKAFSLKGDSYRLKDRDLGRVPAATSNDNNQT